METKSIIIETFNADRAANLARIERFAASSKLNLSSAAVTKAVMVRITSDEFCNDFAYATDRGTSDADALDEILTVAMGEMMKTTHAAESRASDAALDRMDRRHDINKRTGNRSI